MWAGVNGIVFEDVAFTFILRDSYIPSLQIDFEANEPLVTRIDDIDCLLDPDIEHWTVSWLNKLMETKFLV